MKKIFGFLIMIVFVIGLVFAQTTKLTPAQKLKQNMDQLTQVLALTTAQISKITPLVKESIRMEDTLSSQIKKDDSPAGRSSLQKKLDKIIPDLDGKISAFLTKEQQMKLQAFRKLK